MQIPDWRRLRVLVQREWQHLTTIHATDRLWQMPVAAALASGLPLLVGAYFDRLDYGLVSSLGGMVFLYLPGTPLYHRMVWAMACAFGISASYALGLLSHLFAPAMMPMLTFIAIMVTMVCRFYGVGPPGSLFFVMAASIGAYTPVGVLQIPLMVGLITMGSLLACLIGFFYSAYMLRLYPAKPIAPLPSPTFEFVVFDSVVIGAFVGISLVLAQLLHLQKAYWVPVSCLAVIQGASLRAVWNRQLQRVIGTTAGLFVAWGVFLLPLNKWGLGLMIMALTFVVEFSVVRHYAFAVALITPLTILLAEAATLGNASPAALIQARFFDTVLGCAVGLVGGVCLHSPRFRNALGGLIRRAWPRTML